MEQKLELDSGETYNGSHCQGAPPIMCMFQGREVKKTRKNTKHVGHGPGFCSWSQGLN